MPLAALKKIEKIGSVISTFLSLSCLKVRNPIGLRNEYIFLGLWGVNQCAEQTNCVNREAKWFPGDLFFPTPSHSPQTQKNPNSFLKFAMPSTKTLLSLLL